MTYGISRQVVTGYEAAIVRVTEELKKEGFGVLTTIDVSDTFKNKLNVDFPRYVILGACNPALAYRGLREEADLGLLLPCNVTVHEIYGKTTVSAFDPTAMTKIIDNPAIGEIALEIKRRLERVIAAV